MIYRQVFKDIRYTCMYINRKDYLESIFGITKHIEAVHIKTNMIRHTSMIYDLK